MMHRRGNRARWDVRGQARRFVRGLALAWVLIGWISAPTEGQVVRSDRVQECIRVFVRNDYFLDVNIRPYINRIAVGQKLYVQGLSTATFTLKPSTYLNTRLQFAIDPVGSDDVYFVPDLSTLHLPDTSALVRIIVATRLWLSTVSLTDIEGPESACPP